jgi:hypothetical protein
MGLLLLRKSKALPLDAVADVLDRFPNLAPRLAEALLHLSGCLIRGGFVAQSFVACRTAYGILDSAFNLIGFPAQFIVIQHREAPPSSDVAAGRYTGLQELCLRSTGEDELSKLSGAVPTTQA